MSFCRTPLPIHIEYFTAYVDDDGKLLLRDDIYGYRASDRAGTGPRRLIGMAILASRDIDDRAANQRRFKGETKAAFVLNFQS